MDEAPDRTSAAPAITKEPLRDGAFLLHGVLTPEECTAMIERTEALGYESLEGEYPVAYRNNDRVIFTDEELAAELWRRVAPFVPAKLPVPRRMRMPDAEGVEMDAVGLNERFRACRYAPGGHFQAHCDGCFRRDQRECSLLTFNMYLNDVPAEAGGKTRFLPDGPDVQPRAGTVLVFLHNILHDGEGLGGGQKYLLRSDVMYRGPG